MVLVVERGETEQKRRKIGEGREAEEGEECQREERRQEGEEGETEWKMEK